MIQLRFCGILLLILTVGCSANDVERFARQDALTPPPPSPILFVGSSTIRLWDTRKAFPDLPVLNRGFGGSEISDAVFYYDRLVLKYHPSTIVFYSGDNDLAGGKSVEQVVTDMRTFVAKVRADMPATKLIVIAIKPSIARWYAVDKFRQANREFEKIVKEKPGDVFINVEPQILGPNGKPRAEFFRIDGLHFNDKGYDILNAAVKPYLGK